MHVQELTLTNVRQFEDDSFNFKPGFNLVVGENGKGKTTLLRSLLAVLSKTNRANPHQVFTDDDIRLKSDGHMSITATLAEGDGWSPTNLVYRRSLGSKADRRSRTDFGLLVMWYGSNEAVCKNFASREVKRVTKDKITEPAAAESYLSHQILPQIDIETMGEKFGRSEELSHLVRHILKNLSDKFVDFQWTFEPFGCSIVPPEKIPENFESIRGLRRKLESAVLRYFQEVATPLRQLDREFVTINPSGYLVGSPDEKQFMPSFRELLERTQSYTRDAFILEECNVQVRLTPRIRISTISGDRFLLSQLSDGEKRLFSLFVDIARQLLLIAPNVIGFRDIPAVILIDEIDVHLHPKWQRKIVPALEDLFPACQFIATTHSPFVIQAVKENRVQHLNRPLPDTFSDRGIEEIAAKVMGIEDHQVSARYLEMLNTAKEYFHVLEESRVEANPIKVAEFRSRLRNLSHRYAENPAYQAYLDMHGQLTLCPEELR